MNCKFPTPEEIERAADNYWMGTDGEEETDRGYFYTGRQIEEAFKAGANWHRYRVEPLLERVRNDLAITEDSVHQILDFLTSNQARTIAGMEKECRLVLKHIREALSLLSEEGTK